MSVGKTILYGSSISKNMPPALPADPKVVLKGEFSGKPASFGLDSDVLSKHMMLVGGTGCGKSTLFYHIMSQLKSKMTQDDVMIIFDSKGDFYSRFYRPGDVVIGNSPQYRQDSEHWNIFRELVADGWEDPEILVNAQEICKGFFAERVKNSSANAFFPNAARDLLSAILVTFTRMGRDDKDFRNEWMYNSALREYLDGCTTDLLIDLLEDSPDMQSVLSYIVGDGPQGMGVLSEMFSVMRDILMGVFARKGGFSMRSFVRQKGGRTLFIEYDLSIGSVLTPVYKQLFDLALKEAMGRNKSEGNVYFFCDEFKLIPHLEHIDDGVNFGRSLGVKIFAGLQSIEQLYEIYGPSRGKNLAAGFSSIIGFRANDVTTRGYLSELFGKNLVLEQYKKMDNTYVEEKRSGCTVEDWDMNDLRVGEAVVGLPFSQPFRFYFEMYR